jgi:cell division septation protein DedD
VNTTQVQDDGFHEIQLNGKQLVFLFMAATVVSVVIFLCGVLVGRGVKAERTALTSDAGSAPVIQDAPPLPPAQTSAANEPAAAAPPVVQEDKFSYPDRLEDASRKETLKPASTPPPTPIPVPKSAAPVAAVAPRDTKPETKPEPKAPAAPAATHGDGYAIQVAALREPGEADTIAKRLVSKGYDAYVLTPPGGTPNVYRVRVGSFKTRRDAEPTAAKLQQEEQFKPWITR